MNMTLLLSQACEAVDGNIGTWGACIQESWFMNSPEFMGLALYITFGVIIYRTRMPLPIILSVNLILSYILASVTSATTFNIMFVLSIILVMGAIAISIIKRFWR